MFRITAFATLAGVSSKVLRDYGAAGLFRPAWVDPETGYRMYSPAQLPELRRILALRDLGVGLEEIGSLVREKADLVSVLHRRREALEAARQEAERRLAQLGITLGRSSEGVLDVVVRDVAPELVAVLDVALTGGDDGRAFYELEREIRDRGIRAPRPPGELLDDLSVQVFVPVRRHAAGLDVRRLPRVRAATILHHGSYATMARTEAALESWMRAAQLRPAGPRRVLYLQFGAEADLRLPQSYLVERAADLVTEIQIPIG